MFEDLKSKIIEFGKLAGQKDLTPGISGNISARVDDRIIITASGSANGYLEDQDLVVIDFDGNIIDGVKRPSSEYLLHLKFYSMRPDINSIFHVHSSYLTAFASSGVSLDKGVSPEIIYCFGKFPLAKYAIPGSELLVDETCNYFTDYDAVLMANHGVIVGGTSVKQAYLNLELAEAYAKTIICTKFLGGAKILSDEEVNKIYLLRNK